MKMPFNVPVRIYLRDDGNFVGGSGKPFEDVVLDEIVVMGDVYFMFKHRKMLWGGAIKGIEVLDENGEVITSIDE